MNVTDYSYRFGPNRRAQNTPNTNYNSYSHHNYRGRPRQQNQFLKNLAPYFFPQPKRNKFAEDGSGDSSNDGGTNCCDDNSSSNYGGNNSNNSLSNLKDGHNGDGNKNISSSYNKSNSNVNEYSNNGNGNSNNGDSNIGQGNGGDVTGSSSQVLPPGYGKPKRPAPNEGPLGLLIYGGSGTTGFVIFMVVGVIVAIVASALVTIGTTGGRSFGPDPVDDLTRIVLNYVESVPKYW